MARIYVFRFKGTQLEPRQIGRELNVSSVLVGSVSRKGQSFLVNTELVDVNDGSLVWGKNYVLSQDEISAIQSIIAQDISTELNLKLSPAEEKLVAQKYTADSAAYQLYLKGRYHWNKRTPAGFAKGIEYFEQAIQKDPNYALPYVGLADSFDLLGYYGLVPAKVAMPKAKEAATRALQLDGSLADAHASLGDVLYFYDHDWNSAEREFRRAIELNPEHAVAHHWFGLFLIAMGREKEAEAELRTAHELDPLSLSNNAGYVRQLYFARRYGEAIEQYRKSLERIHRMFMPRF